MLITYRAMVHMLCHHHLGQALPDGRVRLLLLIHRRIPGLQNSWHNTRRRHCLHFRLY